MLKTVDLSLKVLKKFTLEKSSWGARELAKEMGINHTNIYRILETLEKNGFVNKHPDTKKYSLGFAILELSGVVHESLNLDHLIRPILQSLCEETGESVFLTVLDREDAITLMVVEPKNKVKFSVAEGSRAPIYVGASYRSILAYQPDEFVEKTINNGLTQYTEKTMTDPDTLRKELLLIREQGYAESQGEYTPDVVAIAVPVKDSAKLKKASITVSGPVYRFQNGQKEKILPQLIRARDKVELALEQYQMTLNV